MSPVSRRKAFSLVELLVVTAIITVLIGILLPAIAKARESANRARCQNNMKQIALAVHLHHTTFGHLPANGSAMDSTTVNGWSAFLSILPFMEQTQLYNQCKTTAPAYTSATATVVPSFVCPSDIHAKVVTFSHAPAPQAVDTIPVLLDYSADYYQAYFQAIPTIPAQVDDTALFVKQISFTTSPTSYSLCWGNGPFDPSNEPDNAFQYYYRRVNYAHVDLSISTIHMIPTLIQFVKIIKYTSPQPVGNGMFPTEATLRPVPMSAVTDGLSYTAMAGEQCSDPKTRFFGWNTPATGASATTFHGINRSHTSFNTMHVNMMNIAMGDGSVRPISVKADLEILHAIGSRNGGEVVNDTYFMGGSSSAPEVPPAGGGQEPPKGGGDK